jgi:Asp-tRNA(Asn)/Glu-tRNA(Gln) amidotransferase B subunit
MYWCGSKTDHAKNLKHAFKFIAVGWCGEELPRYIRARGYDIGPNTKIKKLSTTLIEVVAEHVASGTIRKRWVKNTVAASGVSSWQWLLKDPSIRGMK